ncbi:MAG: hypothetical protein WAK17_02730 [Candidatus Nitrosopolaris sp.]
MIKKNTFVVWTGNSADKPILKNLDGMSGRYPTRYTGIRHYLD